jgi:hypothetical protein
MNFMDGSEDSMQMRNSISKKAMPYAHQTVRLLLAFLFTAAMTFDSNRALAQDKRKPTAISKEQAKQRLKRLRNRGITVFYPNYVPARFSLVSAGSVPNTDCPNLDYALKFCDKNRLCFSIESACSGIGSAPGGDKSLNGRSKIFGRFRIEHFNPTKGDRSVYYLSEWWADEKIEFAEKKGISRGAGRYHHFLGYGVSDQEAVDIVKSLMPLK